MQSSLPGVGVVLGVEGGLGVKGEGVLDLITQEWKLPDLMSRMFFVMFGGIWNS